MTHLHILPSGEIFLNEKKLKTFLDDGGYPCIRVTVEGKRLKRRVHRLNAERHLGPAPSSDHEVLHKDGNRKNFHISNLRWGTKKENAQDREYHRRLKKHGQEMFELLEGIRQDQWVAGWFCEIDLLLTKIKPNERSIDKSNLVHS